MRRPESDRDWPAKTVQRDANPCKLHSFAAGQDCGVDLEGAVDSCRKGSRYIATSIYFETEAVLEVESNVGGVIVKSQR